ncbi:inositol-3-phosphate synthase [Nocardioidaceae bacterium SCSIO 66511]|nr:inositol-3-phosphate synthase [Nocardioidaceae bacterium SCSIO 66511]
MDEQVGIWFIGARGSLATTAAIGAYALAGRLVEPTGCVTTLVDDRGLVGYENLVIGGHDVSELPLAKRAEQLVAGRVVPQTLVDALGSELTSTDARIRPGVRDGADQRATIERLTAEITEFAQRSGVARTVVVDVSSTEPPRDPDDDLASWSALEAAWDAGRSPLAPSSMYACAALLADCAYVGFTPSPGIEVPALRELAENRGLPYAGRDGKTGETLVKSVLAPMFASRALPIRSWTSVNLLGGGDGETLADPTAAASKTGTKQEGLDAIVGHHVDGPMHIDYVSDLGDWKTAWDHIRFDGFLGAQMTLQFTWQGCDSALAAPLVLDLVRLIDRANALGDAGPVPELGFFFKAPLASDEHRLPQQWESLRTWATDCGERTAL